MKKLKFSQVKPRIVNTPGFRSLKEIKQAGYRIVKERPACHAAQRRRQGRVLVPVCVGGALPKLFWCMYRHAPCRSQTSLWRLLVGVTLY